MSKQKCMMNSENEIRFDLIGGKHHADYITQFKSDFVIAKRI